MYLGRPDDQGENHDWVIAIPAEIARSNSEAEVHAEVVDRGWNGTSVVQLGKNHSPPVKVTLKQTDKPISGMVLSNGHTVANARVTVAGSGAVFTDRDGLFQIASRAKPGDKVKLHAEGNGGVADLDDYEVGSAPAILKLEDPSSPKKSRVSRPTAVTIEHTGDSVIDGVLARLAALKVQKSTSENDLQQALIPLSSRPAFKDGIRHEDWQRFLYTLFRTRMILSDTADRFKSNNDQRNQIWQAVSRMKDLENRIWQLYRPNFNPAEFEEQYKNDRSGFIAHLPEVVQNPATEFFDQSDQQIREIRALLKQAGVAL